MSFEDISMHTSSTPHEQEADPSHLNTSNEVEADVRHDNTSSLTSVEHEVLDFWKENDVFRKLQERNAEGPFYRFLDGPVTANNPMGVHHAWGRTLKDINLRFRAKNGERTAYQTGFDTQGLWVEVQVERELGLNGKKAILEMGIDEFNRLCKARIDKYSAVQTQQSIRLGQWMNWDDSYYTHTDDNIQGIWKFLSKVSENGWLYRDLRTMPWCARCETSLSEHEMSGSTRNISHQSVTFSTHVPEAGADVLVWTTTPWTIVANTALAVNPEVRYVVFRLPGEDREYLASEWYVNALESSPTIVKTITGAELIGLHYDAILDECRSLQGSERKFVPWTEVDEHEGTGIVHIAPGCGPEDFQLGKEQNLGIIAPVNEKGVYREGFGSLSGQHIKEVTSQIFDKLRAKDKFFNEAEYEHACPCCWRCHEEVIFRPASEWFISTSEIRDSLINAAKQVEWFPEHMGLRMQDWLTQMDDWCISRKRFWGLPLPIYPCDGCGTTTVIDSKESLKELALQKDLVDAMPDLHRPFIDEIEIVCPCCTGTVQRISEVGDCWLDAGIAPFTTQGAYGDWQAKEDWQPVDYEVEMSEQVRLWFYSQLFMSTTLTGQAPYKKVQTHERVLKEDGTKFSKTGDMIEFGDAVEKMGADTMRLLFARQNPTSDIRFGYNLGDLARRPLLTLKNIVSFYDTYAQIDMPELAPLAETETLANPTDIWLLARLDTFIEESHAALSGHEYPIYIRAFESFIDDLSNWYIRTNRRRFWKGEDDADKKAAYRVLHHTIESTLSILSPVAPFFTEDQWQKVVRKYSPQALESVHLSRWPTPLSRTDSAEILDQTVKVRSLLTEALHLRAKAKIKVRQPLQALEVVAKKDFTEACRRMEAIIKEELNIKEVRYSESTDGIYSGTVELDFKKAGPTLKDKVQAFATLLRELPDEDKQQIAKQVQEENEVSVPGWEGLLPHSLFLLNRTVKSGLAVAEDADYTLVLHTELTEELRQEGLLRDVTRHVQTMRKESGLDILDRVVVGVTGSANVVSAIQNYKEYLEREALAQVVFEEIEDPSITKELSFHNDKARVSVKYVKP